MLTRALFFVSLGLTLAKGGSTPSASGQAWLLTSHVPQFLEQLEPHVKYIRKSGRHWVVIKKNPSQFPLHLSRFMRRVKMEELLSYEPPLVEFDETDTEVAELVSRVRKENVAAVIKQIISVPERTTRSLGNHPDSGNIRTVELIENQMKQLGLEVHRHCYKEKEYDPECNIIATRVGESLPDEWIVLMAHLDDVGHPFAGADDNASGISGLVEAARVLAHGNYERSIMFLITNGEENVIVGSRAFVREHPQLLDKIIFGINLDMIAYNENGKVDIETEEEYRGLADWIAERAQLYTSLTPVVSIPTWGSDHMAFLEADVPAVYAVEHWATKNECYHKDCDKEDKLNLDYATEIVKLIVAATAEKAGYLDQRKFAN